MKREACGESRDRCRVATRRRRLAGPGGSLPGRGVCGELRSEAEAQPGEKDAASRTEPQQDSRVQSPVCEETRVREIGKMDE